MEKKKKKTGRAKKRMLYNRRFVTMAVGFGAKRGVTLLLYPRIY